MSTHAPDTANQNNLLFQRFTAFLEQNEEAFAASTELAAAHFHLYAHLRAERFTADEAHRCLTTLCKTYADSWRMGILPGHHSQTGGK